MKRDFVAIDAYCGVKVKSTHCGKTLRPVMLRLFRVTPRLRTF
jgi:hypothetical protein